MREPHESEDLFLNVIAELHSRMMATSHYDALRSSGILRQLLMDAEPLVHAVNREHRIPIQFKVLRTENSKPGYGVLSMQGFVPTPRSGMEQILELDLKKFLGMTCFVFNYDIMTVGEVIRISSNIRGGVHLGTPSNDKESRSLSWVKEGPKLGFKNGQDQLDILLGMIPLISTVVLQALLPIYQRILSIRQGDPA